MVENVQQWKSRIRAELGRYGMRMLELSRQKQQDEKKQQYSLSMIAAISFDKVISHQVVEGGIDSVIFENFIYNTLYSLRT